MHNIVNVLCLLYILLLQNVTHTYNAFNPNNFFSDIFKNFLFNHISFTVPACGYFSFISLHYFKYLVFSGINTSLCSRKKNQILQQDFQLRLHTVLLTLEPHPTTIAMISTSFLTAC